MVVSKSELKKYVHDKLKMRVSSKALNLLKENFTDHKMAEKVLDKAAHCAKDLKKGTILEIHIKMLIEGYKLCEKQ